MMLINYCYQPIPKSPTRKDDPRLYRQRSVQWFNFWKGKTKGSKASFALGWYCRKAMLDYWDHILRDLHGLPTKSGESNLAMLWGSINEDSALVTYLNNIFPEDSDGVVLDKCSFLSLFLGHADYNKSTSVLPPLWFMSLSALCCPVT